MAIIWRMNNEKGISVGLAGNIELSESEIKSLLALLGSITVSL